MVTYKLNIPPKLFEAIDQVARGSGKSVSRFFRDSIKWVLLEGAVKKRGGKIFVEPCRGAGLIEINLD